MKREDALKVTCPKCGAPPSMPCMGKRAARLSCHIERHPNAWDGRRAPNKHTRADRCNTLGWVYLIAAPGTGSAKIGFSAKYPDRRQRNLQTANPVELQLLALVRGTRRDEQRYHDHFAHIRIRGEWFQDCAELRDYFGEMMG